jgi:AraC-like DNA-binding protein
MNMVGHGPFGLFGVYLWPWAVRAFFQLEPSQCRDLLIDLEQLCGAATNELEQAIQQATSTDERVEHCARFLRERGDTSQQDHVLEPMIMDIHGSETEASLEALIENSGLSRRSFERRFKECTSYSPATYLRILRFQRTYRMLENGSAHSLTDIAHASGYFDQSHFIRDFKRFSGLNPRSYFVRSPARVDNFLRLPQD